MTDNIKRINIREFREFGFLQEANRLFFHPLGLALEVVIEDDGTEHLGGVWDYRDDPGGLVYSSLIDWAKASRVHDLKESKRPNRVNEFGFEIQGR